MDSLDGNEKRRGSKKKRDFEEVKETERREVERERERKRERKRERESEGES